jgi:hypothetical protein
LKYLITQVFESSITAMIRTTPGAFAMRMSQYQSKRPPDRRSIAAGLAAILGAVAMAGPAMARPREVTVAEDLPLYSYHLLVPVVAAADGLCIRLGNWSGGNRVKVEWSDRKALLNLEAKPDQTQQLDVPAAVALASSAIVLYSDQAILPTIAAGRCTGDRKGTIAAVKF